MTPAAAHGADLHVHTVYSDGAHTPEDIAAAARGKDLAAVAITDHDTLDGVDAVRRAAGPDGPEIIAGVEFGTPSGNACEYETHILGLFLDLDCAELQDTLARYRKLRHDRALRIIGELNRAGIVIQPDRVLSFAGHGCVARPHVARALVERGHASSINHAFRQWLSPGRPAFVPRERPPVAETIALIHRSGGLAVFAHPGKTGRDDEIPRLVECGLDAIEVYYPEHSADDRRRYLKLADRHGLLVSGGSDSHGHEGGGTAIGDVRLDATHLQAIRARAARTVRQSA